MRLNPETGRQILADNIERLYHLPTRYKYINHYLRKGTLKQTILKILNYAKDKDILIYKHKYCFVLDNTRLTYTVRKKQYGNSTSNRHFNLLCCIGLINKLPESAELEVNKRFLAEHPDKSIDLNSFYFRRYTEKELKRLEKRAELLYLAGVNISNISNVYLRTNGLTDLADEVFYRNSKTAARTKEIESIDLFSVIDLCVEIYGYCTKQMIRDNLLLSDKELDRLISCYRKLIEEKYRYSRPTKEERERFALKDYKFIYTERTVS